METSDKYYQLAVTIREGLQDTPERLRFIAKRLREIQEEDQMTFEELAFWADYNEDSLVVFDRIFE